MGAKAGIKSAEYEAYAASQINYMLGDNPNNFSYVIGYGDSFPKQPHHKAAACASPPAQCTWGTFSNTGTDNPHQLNGALVGGPAAPDDHYKDDRSTISWQRLPLTTMLGSKAPLQASKVFPVEQKQKEETEAQFCKKEIVCIFSIFTAFAIDCT